MCLPPAQALSLRANLVRLPQLESGCDMCRGSGSWSKWPISGAVNTDNGSLTERETRI